MKYFHARWDECFSSERKQKKDWLPVVACALCATIWTFIGYLFLR